MSSWAASMVHISYRNDVFEMLFAWLPARSFAEPQSPEDQSSIPLTQLYLRPSDVCRKSASHSKKGVYPSLGPMSNSVGIKLILLNWYFSRLGLRCTFDKISLGCLSSTARTLLELMGVVAIPLTGIALPDRHLNKNLCFKFTVLRRKFIYLSRLILRQCISAYATPQAQILRHIQNPIVYIP